MSMYPHRSMGGVPQSNSRLNELLDQIRAEFDNQLRLTQDYEQQSKSSQVPGSLLSHSMLYPKFTIFIDVFVVLESRCIF